MPRINEYVRSLPGVARRTIERVLKDTSAGSSRVLLRTAGSIDTSELRPLGLVSPNKINSILTHVSSKNADVWNTVDEVDNYIRSISERCDAIISRSSRSANRSSAILRAVFMAASRKETIDSLYVETFSNFDRTDSNVTTAIIENDKLVLPLKITDPVSGQWSIKSFSPTSAVVSIDKSTGTISARCSVENTSVAVDPLSVTASFSMTSPTTATTLKLNISSCDVDKVRITNASGETQEILVNQRSRMNELCIVSFPRTSISLIEVDLAQRHYNINPSNGQNSDSNPIYASVERLVRRSANGSVANRRGFISTRSIYRKVKTASGREVMGEWATARALGRIRMLRKKNRTGSNSTASVTYSMTLSITSMNLYDTIRKETAQWVSAPIEMYGDVRKIFMSIDQDSAVDTNTRWYVSVEGRPWTPIIPENARQITGEILSFDFAGTASLAYPADANASIRLHGIPNDAVVKTVTSSNGNIIGIKTDKVTGTHVTIDYDTTLSGIVKLDEIGLTSSDVKVSDAMTDGNLGEHGTVNGRMTLRNEPHGEVDVYVDGVKSILLPSTDSIRGNQSLDTTLSYYQISGRTIFLKDDSSRKVSAYYKYAHTSLRIKAILESSLATSGRTPEINAVTVGVKTMSA